MGGALECSNAGTKKQGEDQGTFCRRRECSKIAGGKGRDARVKHSAAQSLAVCLLENSKYPTLLKRSSFFVESGMKNEVRRPKGGKDLGSICKNSRVDYCQVAKGISRRPEKSPKTLARTGRDVGVTTPHAAKKPGSSHQSPRRV